MKKFIVLIAAVCYFVVTCGIVVNFHFCMDKLASVSFFVDETDKCGLCGMDIHQSSGCCRDEMQVLKMDDDQDKTLVVVYEIPSLEPVIAPPSDYIDTGIYNVNERRDFHNHSPPLLSEQDTYLQNRVFRI